MTEMTVMAKLAANKKVVVIRSLIVAGTVVCIALTAGFLAKNKNVFDATIEAAK
jgi:hypothetical protein